MERKFFYESSTVIQDPALDIYDKFQPTIQAIQSAFPNEIDGLFAIFNKVRIKHWRVEMVPTFKIINVAPAQPAAATTPIVYGNMYSCYPRQFSQPTTYIDAISISQAPRFKMTEITKKHIRSFRAETMRSDQYFGPDSSATTYASAMPVRFPWCDISYDDGYLSDTFPPVLPCPWLIQAALGATNAEVQTFKVYYIVTLQFKDKR